MDPQQRLFLEVGYDAFFRARYHTGSLLRTNTGVFVATAPSNIAISQSCSPFAATGADIAIVANRISFVHGLRGPSIMVDTACSASLVAADIGLMKLRSAQCPMALAAGVQLLVSLDAFIGLCSAHMLSSDGRCRTFEASADGYARGEGCGAVLLEAEPHAAYEQIAFLGSALNQDGRSASLTAPNGPSQQAVLRAALLDSGCAPADL
jgi:acyl transferase domain-containing protein